MKVAPVSADLLVKLALGALVIGAAVYGLRQLREAAGAGLEAAGEAADAVIEGVTPWSPENIFNRAVNAAGSAVAPAAPTSAGRNADGSWTLGGALFDLLNPGTAQAVRDMSGPVNTGGATGDW